MVRFYFDEMQGYLVAVGDVGDAVWGGGNGRWWVKELLG